MWGSRPSTGHTHEAAGVTPCHPCCPTVHQSCSCRLCQCCCKYPYTTRGILAFRFSCSCFSFPSHLSLSITPPPSHFHHTSTFPFPSHLHLSIPAIFPLFHFHPLFTFAFPSHPHLSIFPSPSVHCFLPLPLHFHRPIFAFAFGCAFALIVLRFRSIFASLRWHLCFYLWYVPQCIVCTASGTVLICAITGLLLY